MATASVEVSGLDAEALAEELRAVLAAAADTGDSVSAVEVDRSPELIVAIIGLVFSGVTTAKTLWDWWTARRPSGVTVTILLSDGTKLDLAGADQHQLQLALDPDASSRPNTTR